MEKNAIAFDVLWSAGLFALPRFEFCLRTLLLLPKNVTMSTITAKCVTATPSS